MQKTLLTIVIILLVIQFTLFLVGNAIVIPRTYGSITFVNYFSSAIFLKPLGISLVGSVFLTVLYVGWNWQKGLAIESIKMFFYISFSVIYIPITVLYMYEIFVIVVTSLKV